MIFNPLASVMHRDRTEGFLLCIVSCDDDSTMLNRSLFLQCIIFGINISVLFRTLDAISGSPASVKTALIADVGKARILLLAAE